MDKRITSIVRDTDGWWVFLKPGFVVSDEGAHAIVEDTKKAALAKMALVEPCACDDCKRLIGIIDGIQVFG